VAKPTGLGKGLGALLKETSVSPASVTSVGALKTKTASQGNLPDCIEVDENGGLWIDPSLLIPSSLVLNLTRNSLKSLPNRLR